MALDAGAVSISMTLDDAKFRSGLRSAGKGVSDFSGSAKQSLDGVSSSFGDLVKGLSAAAAFAALGGGMAKLAQEGGKLEQTFVSFQTFLGGSKQAADKMIASLNEFANVTPFTNEQVIKAGKSLLAFGASADSIQKRLRAIGDISAGVGKDFNELATIYGKAMTAGVIQAEDLNQLTEAGIPIIKQFAQQFKTSEGNIKKLGSEGKIKFADLEKAFEQMTGKGGLFFNLMEKQSGTFLGLLSTLQGALGTLGAEIGMTLNEILKPALKAIGDAALNLLKWWQSLDPSTKTIIVTVTLLAAALAVLIPLWPLIATGILAVGAAFKTAFLTNPIGIVILGVVAAVTTLIAAWESLNSGQKGFVIESLSSAFRSLKTTIGSVADSIKSLLSGDSLKFNFGDFVKDAGRHVGRFLIVFSFGLEKLPAIFKNAFTRVSATINTWLLEFEKVWLKFRIFIDEKTQPGTVALQKMKVKLDDVNDSLEDQEKILAKATSADREFQKELAKRLSLFDKMQGKTIAPDGTKTNAKQQSGSDTGKMKKTWQDAAIELGNAFLSTLASVVESAFTIAENRLKQTVNTSNLLMDVWSAKWAQEMDLQLETLMAAEDAKIQILHEASFERLAIMDAEFAHQKALLEQELAARLAAIDAERAMRDAYVEENAAFQEQEFLIDAANRDDANRLKEEAEREFQEKLRNLEQGTTAKRQEERDKTAAAVDQANKEKAQKEKDFQKKREEEEKKHAKTRAFISYGFELAAHTMAQQKAAAMARISLAQALMSALTASMPYGLAGIGVFAALSALAGTVFAMSMSAISSTPPPMPPAELFMAEGGKIMGPRHSQGGVMVNAEGGEAFLSRTTTANLDAFLSRSDSNGGAQYNFHDGSIRVLGSLDSRSTEIIAEAIAEKQGDMLHRVTV